MIEKRGILQCNLIAVATLVFACLSFADDADSIQVPVATGGWVYDYDIQLGDNSTLGPLQRWAAANSKEEIFLVGGVALDIPWQSHYGDGLIVKLSPKGIPLWGKTIGGPKADYFQFISRTSDDGSILAGYTNTSGYYFVETDGPIWLVKLKADGTLVWQKSYVSPVKGDATIDYLAQTTDKGYVLVTEGEKSGCCILKLDQNGAIVWQRAYPRVFWDVLGFWDGRQGFARTADNGLFLPTSDTTPSGDVSWPSLVKFDSSGAVAWEKLYTFPILPDTDNYGMTASNCRVTETVDGNYAIAGLGTMATSDQYLYAVKVSPSGDPLWSSVIKLPINIEMFTKAKVDGILPTSDNGITVSFKWEDSSADNQGERDVIHFNKAGIVSSCNRWIQNANADNPFVSSEYAFSSHLKDGGGLGISDVGNIDDDGTGGRLIRWSNTARFGNGSQCTPSTKKWIATPGTCTSIDIDVSNYPTPSQAHFKVVPTKYPLVTMNPKKGDIIIVSAVCK